MKLSLYEDGIEEAYVVFSKQPGVNDSWFSADRVIRSHPWDIKQLQYAAFVQGETTYADHPNPVRLRWSIAEQGINSNDRASM